MKLCDEDSNFNYEILISIIQSDILLEARVHGGSVPYYQNMERKVQNLTRNTMWPRGLLFDIIVIN